MAKSISAGMASALAADVGSLAPVTDPIKLGLIVAPFSQNPDVLAADLTISAAPGLEPIEGVVGPQFESLDPLTGENVIEVKEPLGGFRWETPVDFVGPTMIYGYALLNNDGTVLWGTESVLPPVQLTAPNQAHVAPPISFRFDVSKVH